MNSKASKRIIYLSSLMFAGFTISPTYAVAAEYEWTFSNPWVRPVADKVYEDFIERVSEYSNGRIEIELYKNGLLGGHEETFHGVRDGSITIGTFSPYASIVPGGVLNWMPWSVTSWSAAEKAYAEDGPLYNVLETAYNEVGMHTLMHVSQGPYGIGNIERPIRTTEDFENLKIRVSGSIGLVRALQGMGEDTGMTLQTLPWSEVYNALSRGVVDGVWTMWPSLIDERHAEVLEHYSDINFAWDNQNVAINIDAWNELPDDLKEAVTRAAAESQGYSHELHQSAEDDFKEQVESMEGITVTYLTDDERAALYEASDVDSIWEEIAEPWLEKAYPGQNMSEELRAELEEINEI